MRLNINKSNRIDVKMDITLPFNVDNIEFKLFMISDVEDDNIYFTKKKIKFIIFPKL